MPKIPLTTCTILLFFHSLCISQDQYTISGYINDARTTEPLISANIYNPHSYGGTVSDQLGFYSITLPSGEQKLSISFIGYNTQDIVIDLQKDTSITVRLTPTATLKEIEIIARTKEDIAKKSQMSSIEVPIAQIEKIPAFLGETDVLKALQLLPGVQSGGEGQSGLYVRGGSPDQNLVLLDGAPIYNVSHLFGFFSVFNADAIEDVNLIKGGYPARFGGRLSSIIDIKMKEGNMDKIHGTGSIGLVASKFSLEGPIVKDKTSFLISGRRTYIDLLAKPILKKQFEDNGEEGDTGYFFYDLNAKIQHIFSDKDKIYASFYTGDDRFFFNVKDAKSQVRDFSDSNLEWGNTVSSITWNHVWSPTLNSNISLINSRYTLDTRIAVGTEYEIDNTEEEISIGYNSGIRDYIAKIDFDWIPNSNHNIKFGVSNTNHKFRPGTFDLKQVGDGINFQQSFGQKNISANELDLYIEDNFDLNDKIKINVGGHASSFFAENKTYLSFQPRISGRYLLSNGSSFKASFATMRQYVHLLAFEGIGLPTDLWLPTTEKVKPQDSWQIALGYAFNISKHIELTIEGYYRSMSNLIAYKEGSGLFEINDWQERITQGNGTSKGVEIFIQKKTGKFSGWLGYTLSYTDRQFDELNFGDAFPYRYDRRHDLSLVAIYELSPRINLSATWVYGTGNAVTIANNQYSTLHPRTFLDAGLRTTNVQDNSSRNNFRMKPYHRGDISINFVKQKKKYKRTWSIGAYNVYNNKNPFFITSGTDTTIDPQGNIIEDNFVLRQQSLFPIIPFVNYSIKF